MLAEMGRFDGDGRRKSSVLRAVRDARFFRANGRRTALERDKRQMRLFAADAHRRNSVDAKRS